MKNIIAIFIILIPFFLIGQINQTQLILETTTLVNSFSGDSAITYSLENECAYVETFRKDGSLKQSGYYIGNKMNGSWKKFDTAGNILLEQNYLQDCLFGPEIGYYPNGMIEHLGFYSLNQNGNEISLGDSFEEEIIHKEDPGIITTVFHSCLAVKDNKWLFFDDSGELMRTEFFVNGVLQN